MAALLKLLTALMIELVVELVVLLKGTSLWVWLTIGLVGLGLTAYAEDLSALIKARQATF